MDETSKGGTGKQKLSGRERCVWAATILFALAVIGLATLPEALRFGMILALERQGATDVEIEDVDFNPFSGRFHVHGVSLTGPRGGGLSEEDFEINLDWLPFARKRFFSPTLSVSGIRIDLERTADGHWIVGGLPVPAGEDGGPARPEGPGRRSGPWGLGLGSFDLRNVEVRIRDPLFTQTVLLERFTMDRARSWAPDEESRMLLEARIGEGRLRLTGRARPFAAEPRARFEMVLDALDLGPYRRLLEPAGITELAALLDVDLKIDLTAGRPGPPGGIEETGTHPGWAGSVSLAGSAGLSGLDAALRQGASSLRLGVGEFRWKGEAGYDLIADRTRGDLRGTATLAVADATIQDADAERTLLEIPKLAVNDLRILGLNSAEIAGIVITGARLIDRTVGKATGSDGPRQIALLEEIRIEDLALAADPPAVEVGRLTIGGLDGFLARTKDGTLELQALLAGLAKDVAAKEVKEPQEMKATGVPVGMPPVFRFGAFRISKGSRIVVADQSSTPPVRIVLEEFDLKAGPADLTSEGGRTPLALGARFGDYAPFELAGEAGYGKQGPEADLTFSLEGFDLKALSSYAEQTIGNHIRNGQLDAKATVGIAEERLDAEADITVRKLDLARSETGRDTFSQKFGMSAGLALSMLEDKKGVIQLKVPIEGDLTDPKFRVHSVVQLALGKAIQSGAMAYFAPLGLSLVSNVVLPPGTTFVIGKLVGWATEIRFDPVSFRPMEAVPDPRSLERMEKMAALLRDRPKVSVIVCGKAVPADAAALAARKADAQKKKKTNDSKPVAEGKNPEKPGPEPSTILEDLARDRAEAVKAYLVGERGVSAKQILICRPEVEEREDATPRAEVSL